jgi:hypothetical protein
MPHSRRYRSWSESKGIRLSTSSNWLSNLAWCWDRRNFKRTMELSGNSILFISCRVKAKFGADTYRSTFDR